ncbi:hypothetical protein [Ruficoccus sp. ZRK36]|uniref:hypothetical protein n=1 Tax=Ruficoccus sp. ZRK36 TaxID=2866311 RepID=UPI001C72E687|nr:hypothetical protein [Ruficoccus sp. ZRK36]QYY35167.1 hypothetical protein K0V07_12780 [Ruficoccus sp. ZRK36]
MNIEPKYSCEAEYQKRLDDAVAELSFAVEHEEICVREFMGVCAFWGVLPSAVFREIEAKEAKADGGES